MIRRLLSRNLAHSRADSYIARVSLVFLAAGSGVIGLASTSAQLLVGELIAFDHRAEIRVAEAVGS